MKAKLLILSGIVLAFSSCSNDILTGGGEVNDPTTSGGTGLATASYTVGGGDQTRAVSTGYWGSATRAASDYDYKFPPEMSKLDTPLEVPAGAVELKDDWSHDQNASVYYIPAEKTVSVQVPNNFGGELYVAGTYKPQNFGNNSNGLTLYVLPSGKFEYTDGININGGTIYNQGEVTLPGFDGVKIQNIYNSGVLNIGSEKMDLDFQKGVSIYSKGGDVFMTGGYNPYWHDANSYQIDFKGTFICDGTLSLNGRTHFQNIENIKDICKVIGEEMTVDATVCAGHIVATTIKFDGDVVQLHPNGLLEADEINMPNSGCQVLAYSESSIGVVECGKLSIHMVNDPLEVAIGQGIYLETKEIYDQATNTSYTDFTELEVASQNHINQGVKVTPSCSADADDDPEPEPQGPSLDLVTDVESPTHDHDADKTDEHRRHLSATSLTFDSSTGNIYASYHMRGGNWGGDTYDKDDIEGCIERWTFNGNKVTIGNWMWTNEFDFNHIILDGNNIVTVGHKGGEKEIVGDNGQKYTDFGGIIGKLPTNFYDSNWDAEDELTREDFEYKYLTTEVPLMADYENESGNVTNQKVDYESAGDGNCVVRVGDNYFVATSAGYGVIDANFKRIKDENGDVLFTSTPGSSKYLVVNDGTVNVLYLNDRAANASEETTSFSATLATLSTEAYPNGANTAAMQSNVSPVDGKNVIAVKDGVVYACLSKGGLQIGNEVVTLEGEDGIRSVNGVAVDDSYIYVANGSYITVLDKATKEIVVERKGNTKKVSANFVEVKEYDGETYVFVAFGQDGIKVYKFNK